MDAGRDVHRVHDHRGRSHVRPKARFRGSRGDPHDHPGESLVAAVVRDRDRGFRLKRVCANDQLLADALVTETPERFRKQDVALLSSSSSQIMAVHGTDQHQIRVGVKAVGQFLALMTQVCLGCEPGIRSLRPNLASKLSGLRYEIMTIFRAMARPSTGPPPGAY